MPPMTHGSLVRRDALSSQWEYRYRTWVSDHWAIPSGSWTARKTACWIHCELRALGVRGTHQRHPSLLQNVLEVYAKRLHPTCIPTRPHWCTVERSIGWRDAVNPGLNHQAGNRALARRSGAQKMNIIRPNRPALTTLLFTIAGEWHVVVCSVFLCTLRINGSEFISTVSQGLDLLYLIVHLLYEPW